ncbi:beta/gamma crystallin domain-containing protein [Methyloprofundus sp.]|uniref:beta/gamma crystallin domain-containing protein n=1 Tax=Methyloprofundus sp. TaxID=2020875 RepID=UPI003D10F6E4
MKHINLVPKNSKVLMLLIVIFSLSTNVYAKKNDCWVDIYDDTQYKGKSIRLKGPIQLVNLFDVQGTNWDKKIESIVVSPKATLTVFENQNFKLTLAEMANHPVLMKSLGITRQDILEDSELIFHPDSKIHGFGEFDFYHKVRSLKITCVK